MLNFLLAQKLIEIIEAQSEYIEDLGKEIGEIIFYASSRGWKSKRYEEGVKARKKINELQDEANKMSGLKLERLKASGEE